MGVVGFSSSTLQLLKICSIHSGLSIYNLRLANFTPTHLPQSLSCWELSEMNFQGKKFFDHPFMGQSTKCLQFYPPPTFHKKLKLLEMVWNGSWTKEMFLSFLMGPSTKCIQFYPPPSPNKTMKVAENDLKQILSKINFWTPRLMDPAINQVCTISPTFAYAS